MNVSELYASVARMGFEASLGSDEGFYAAANRALLQAAALRPASGVCTVNHQPLVNLLMTPACQDLFAPVQANGLTLTARGGKAFYVETDGDGMLYVDAEDSNGNFSLVGSHELSSRGSFVAHKGLIRRDGDFVDGLVRLRFSGDDLYYVRNIALYGALRSDAAEDIPPFAPYTEYDIQLLAPDFLSLDASPLTRDDADGSRPKRFDICGHSMIRLPYDAPGVYRVRYRRKPSAIPTDCSPRDNASDIDLDAEVAALLPLLVAAYVWAGDEPNLAEYYLALYRDRADDLRRRDEPMAPVALQNPSGW